MLGVEGECWSCHLDDSSEKFSNFSSPPSDGVICQWYLFLILVCIFPALRFLFFEKRRLCITRDAKFGALWQKQLFRAEKDRFLIIDVSSFDWLCMHSSERLFFGLFFFLTHRNCGQPNYFFKECFLFFLPVPSQDLRRHSRFFSIVFTLFALVLVFWSAWPFLSFRSSSFTHFSICPRSSSALANHIAVDADYQDTNLTALHDCNLATFFSSYQLTALWVVSFIFRFLLCNPFF